MRFPSARDDWILTWIRERNLPFISLHSGYIRGPAAASPNILSAFPGGPLTSLNRLRPTQIAFARQFSRGALLAIAWESGRISFIPFYFLSEKLIRCTQGAGNS